MRPTSRRWSTAQRGALLLIAAGAAALANLSLASAPVIGAMSVADTGPDAEEAWSPATSTLDDGARGSGRTAPVPAREEREPAPGRDVPVRVVAPAERCGDVPLALTVLGRDFAAEVIETTRTDAQGVARFAMPATDRTLVVDFGFPTSGAWAQALDGTAREATMFLPDLGTLRVVVVDEHAHPVPGPVTLQATVLDASAPATRLHAWSVADGGGCFFVEACGLALELRVSTQDGRESAATRVRGPERAGEVCEARVQLPASRTLRARLFDARGLPLAKARVDVSLATGGPIAQALTADRDGVVSHPAPKSSGRARWARVAFHALDADGERWLGESFLDLGAEAAAVADVYLAPPATLVAGRCVDSDGQPRSDLSLRVQTEGPMVVDKAGVRRAQWIDVPTTTVHADADGAFRVLGVVAAGQRLRLVVTDASAAPLPFALGSQDVVIRVPGRAGWPRARA